MTQWTFEPVMSWLAIVLVVGVLAGLLFIRPNYRTLSRFQLQTVVASSPHNNCHFNRRSGSARLCTDD